MEYRVLGKTGLRVSVFAVGTWQLGGPMVLEGKSDAFPDPGHKQVVDLIRACGDLGINVVDSAELYGDGEAERRIGEAIAGNRDRWIVSTKFGMRRGPAGERVSDSSSGTIRRSLEGSLRRLKTEYVDLYLYHAAPKAGAVEEGRAELQKLQQEGKIRFHGISTNSLEAFDRVTGEGEGEVVMISRSLATHPHELIERASQRQLGILVRGGLEGGRLSGAYAAGQRHFHEEDIRRHSFAATDLSKYAEFARLRPDKSSPVAFALRYLLDSEATHTIVLGGKSIEQYQSALTALNLPRFDASTHKAIASLRRKLFGQTLAKSMFRRLQMQFQRFSTTR